jgi:hypothetical protein
MVPHETVWGMRQAGSPAFWDVPIGVYRMTGDEGVIYEYTVPFTFSLSDYIKFYVHSLYHVVHS